MRRWSPLVLLFLIALIVGAADAQISSRTMTLSAISDCIKDVIAANSVEDNGSVLIFPCTEGRAKALYNFLGQKIRTGVVQDRNGKFENRPFGNNACYHRIEDQNGKSADEFRCDLVMTVGDELKD
jgi:hypothetical protein